MKGDGRRTLRVADTIRALLAEIIRRELDDPRLAALVITGVVVADDLGYADLSVRLLVGDGEQRTRKDLIRRLARVAPRLRRALGARMELKKLPELRFHYDAGHDAQQRVNEILGEIAADPRGAEPEG